MSFDKSRMKLALFAVLIASGVIFAKEAPKIQEFSFPSQINSGDEANVMCSLLSGKSPVQFQWLKNSKPITEKDGIKISSSGRYSILAIHPVTEESSGNYTCSAGNKYGLDSFTAYLAARASPVWTEEPENAETVEGRRVEIRCAARGYPHPLIQWKKMGSDVQKMSTLLFESVVKENEGRYSCEAANGVGETLTKIITIDVHEVPKIQEFSFPNDVKVGDSTTVICAVKRGQEPFEFKWTLNGNLLKSTASTKDRALMLTVNPVEESSVGNYSCVVTNQFGADNFSAYLAVKASPVWIEEPENLETVEGRKVELRCSARGYPHPVTEWKKLGDDRKKMSALLFESVRKENGGEYLCEASNGVGGKLAKIITINVHGEPPLIQPFSFPENLSEGDQAKLWCGVTKGDPPLTFRWFLNSHEIHNGSQFHTSSQSDTSFLIVKQLSEFNSGNFTCQVNNAAGRDTYTTSLVVNASPKWIKEPEGVQRELGTAVTLDCAASGYPQPQITWSKVKGSGTVWNGSSLHFSRLLSEHEGEYMCEAQNSVGLKLRKTITLSVLDFPMIQPFMFPHRLSEGNSAKVLCNIVHGKRPITFEWLRNGVKIDDEMKKKISNQDDFSMLIINDIGSEDAGNYTCIASNKEGSARHTAPLIVEASPQWLETPDDTTALYGSYLQLHCLATGLPPPRVTWLKGEDEVTGEGGRVVAPGNGSLIIHILNEEDEAHYRCLAHNGVGEAAAKEFTLSVDVPARFEDKFSVVTVKKGDSASVRCEATGDQPLSVTWKRDGKELRKSNGGRYEIFETLTSKGLKSELVLREANRVDGQLYTCQTENPYGKDERNIKLLVLEVPATPLDLKVQEIWSRSVSVSWSPPYTGNSPITKYVIQYWKDVVSGGRHRLEEKGVTSAQTSALIKDLHPGTHYGLAIVAENTVGRGEPSDALSFTTGDEEPSSAPMDVNVEVKGSASLLVTWKPPPKSEWNGKLKGYYVGYKMLRDSSHPYSFKTVEYLAGEHMIGSLRKDVEYSVIVKAFNSAGSGPPSQEVIIRTLGGDLPTPPAVFVVSTTENTIKIQWRSLDTKIKVSGHAVYYRKKGDSWQRVTSPTDNSYTLTGLQAGAFYQLYVTANSEYGEGDPSEVVTVKTHENNHKQAVLLSARDDDQPMILDMSLMIPVAASLLALTVVIIAICIWVLKAKSRRNLERAIQEDKRFIYAAAATQRYVDIDKTRSLPAYHDPALFPIPYATVPMAEDLLIDDQEMKAPQNRPGTLKKQRDSHIYDSPQ